MLASSQHQQAPKPSAIHSWLDGVPDVQLSLKRRAEEQSLHPPPKRRALHRVRNPPQSMPSSTGKRRQSRSPKNNGSQSPQKRSMIGTPSRTAHVRPEDVEITPRAIHPPLIHADTFGIHIDSDILSSGHETRSSQSRSSTKASDRSRSPQKINELESWHGGLRYRILERRGFKAIGEGHALWQCRELLMRFTVLKSGAEILPAYMRDHLLANSTSSDELELTRPHVYDATDKRDALGQPPAVDRIVEIVQDTESCIRLQEHEAGWNSLVHHNVLRLAWRSSQWKNKLDVANITTARIKPTTLLPSRVSGEQSRSKIVDFAIVLEPSPVLSAAYKNLDPYDPSTAVSFNQTPMNTILSRPIAVSIETKNGGGDGEKARVQLATWVSAQMKHLRSLVRSTAAVRAAAIMDSHSVASCTLPPLPLVAVDGPRWALLIATASPTNTEDELWECGSFGMTDSVFGTYQVVAVLQLLMQWAHETYRPWFERWAAPLTPDERVTLLR